MPDPFPMTVQARPRPFPVPERVEVEIDGLETKYLPLSALPRETLVAMVEEWRAKVLGAAAPAPEPSPDLIRVGDDGDPIRVEFRRKGGRWVYRCLHTDEALRGKFDYLAKNGRFVTSARYPEVGTYTVLVWGSSRTRDNDRSLVADESAIHDYAAAVREAMPAARRMVEEAKR